MPSKAHRGRKIAATAGIGILSVLVLGLGSILVVGGLFVPATYLQPWSAGYHKQFQDPRMQVVALALLAPSGHNMQPWIIRFDPSDPNALHLYVDSKRLTLAVDPLARQTLVSQGTFLAYLRVAAQHLGYSAKFALFPNGTYDERQLKKSMDTLPVATITLARVTGVRSPDYASLYLSDTNRAAYTTKQLTATQQCSLLALSKDPSVRLRLFTDAADVRKLGQFGVNGTLIESRYAAATAEFDQLFYSTEQSKNAARSGFAVEGQGTTVIMKYLLQGAITIYPPLNDDSAGAKNQIALTATAVAHTRAWGIISTAGNTRAEQVRAGILYADFSLRARTLGLVMQPLSQVLQEYSSMSAQYAAVHAEYAANGSTIQMMVRIGTPTSQYPPTMRRSATSLIRSP